MIVRYFRVRGSVQGVGFRWWARRTARELGIGGWVKNLPDGSVGACAEGPEGRVASFREALARGPATARVREVEELESPPPWSEFPGKDFDIR